MLQQLYSTLQQHYSIVYYNNYSTIYYSNYNIPQHLQYIYYSNYQIRYYNSYSIIFVMYQFLSFVPLYKAHQGHCFLSLPFFWLINKKSKLFNLTVKYSAVKKVKTFFVHYWD
jgi:hypothetical protein